MLLAGQRQRPGRALPPSERNYSRGRLSRSRNPHRVSEAAGGGAETAPPHRPRPPPWLEWSSGPGHRCHLLSAPSQGRRPDRSGSGPSRKTGAQVPGRLQERVAAPQAQAPSSRAGPGRSLGERVSGLSGAGPRRGSEKGSPVGLDAHSPLGPCLRPLPPLRAPRRRRTGGHADPLARDGVLSRSAHVRSLGRRRPWFPAARGARR